ncbi:hypothetical protein HPB52_003481 [Rhipicephalus sanguineus]|uniref:THAP-type domain-containing protein n=1 Tax=Rhipicephalus sanguineus TaxID=34632 RepID=A0A9D4QA47_RHISA|nr:hypothetical protein HPB52_003481 [Rhipicephalus sanguineus]
MPQYLQNHCYAPGCQTGYVSVKGGPKLSLFVPKDGNRRKEWEKNLCRADKRLEDTSAVCEIHFEPSYVLMCILSREKKCGYLAGDPFSALMLCRRFYSICQLTLVKSRHKRGPLVRGNDRDL